MLFVEFEMCFMNLNFHCKSFYIYYISYKVIFLFIYAIALFSLITIAESSEPSFFRRYRHRRFRLTNARLFAGRGSNDDTASILHT